MHHKDNRFRGCFTAICTPFTAGGASAIDLAALDRLLDQQAAGNVRGVIIAGTTGETPTVASDEYASLCRHAVAGAHKRNMLAVIGTGSNSTHHACELQRFASDLGADAALSVNPYYNKPTQAGLIAHFSAVADAADIPVILYNIPGRTGVRLELPGIEQLAAHPRIVAIKDAAADLNLTSETARRCPTIAVLSGDDALTLPMFSVGAVGVVSVASNIAPVNMASLCEHALAGRYAEALENHRELSPLFAALFVETNPIPAKAALEILGLASHEVRLPLTPASQSTIERLRSVISELRLPISTSPAAIA